MKKIGVALLGLGVVGGGTYEILTTKRDYIRANDGIDVEVKTQQRSVRITGSNRLKLFMACFLSHDLFSD